MPDSAQAFERWLARRLQEIREEQEPFGAYSPIPGADARELEAFESRVRSLFGVELPREYTHFLSVQNGGGQHAGLFGTRTFQLATPSGDVYVDGLVEENLRLRSNVASFDRLLVYGATDLEYVVQDLATGGFSLRDKTGAGHVGELPDMGAVIKFALT